MIEIDEISGLVSVDTEWKMAELEEELKPRAFTLGFFSPPFNEVRVEEALSQRLPNLYGQYYGEVSDLCVSFDLHSRTGEGLQTFPAPRQAAGPDWKNFLLGSGKSLGYIYRASLKLFPEPSHHLYWAVGLAHDIASHQLERELIREELNPWVFGRFGSMQLPPGLRLPKFPLVLLGAWAGSKDAVDARKRRFAEVMEGRYAWQWVEGKKLQKHAHQVLHERYPLQPWGGPRVASREEGRVKLESEILAALKGKGRS